MTGNLLQTLYVVAVTTPFALAPWVAYTRTRQPRYLVLGLLVAAACGAAIVPILEAIWYA